MNVFFDTNIFVNTNDFHCKSTSFKLFLENRILNAYAFSYYIPEICLDELINKYEENISSSYSKIADNIKKLNNLINSNYQIELNIIQKVEEYRIYLDKLLQSIGITIIPYPKINHKSVVKRILKKIKPFDSNENGYRDYIIWESIKTIISTSDDHQNIFLTDNVKDFCEKNTTNEIHPDLRCDIHSLREISIIRSMKDFVNTYVYSADDFMEWINNIGKNPIEKNPKDELNFLHDNELFSDICGVLSSDIVLYAILKEDSKKGIFKILDYNIIKSNFLNMSEVDEKYKSQKTITVQLEFQFNISTDSSTYSYKKYSNDAVIDKINKCYIITTCQYLEIKSCFERNNFSILEAFLIE
jgi:hypothetical protein